MTEQQLQIELSQVKLLSALTYPALRRVVQHGRLVQARAGQVIIGPGFGSTGFFVVLEGAVTASMPFGPILQELEQGDCFGEIALLDGVERTAYCRATADTLLFEISYESFHADLVANPVVREALDEQTAQRLKGQQDVRNSMAAAEKAAAAEAAEAAEVSAAEADAASDLAPSPSGRGTG